MTDDCSGQDGADLAQPAAMEATGARAEGTMDMVSCRITLADLWQGGEPWSRPLALLDLGQCDAGTTGDYRLPPCPVIAVGNRSHPLAHLADVVIERPFGLETVVRNVLAKPRAASAIAGLLRVLPGMTPVDGLAAESLAYAVLQGSAEHADWLAGRAAGVSAPPEGRVQVARRDNRLELTLDNAGQGNAIDRTMRDQLRDALELALLDDTIGRVVLRGTGRCFSLGAELAEFGTTRDPATAHAIRQQTLPAHQAWRLGERLEAEVQGACVGAGLELAAFAGRVTARRDAWFQLPELAMGVLPGAGGCVSLTRRIGRQRTALLILSGKRINAGQALEWGLVDAVVGQFSGDDGHPDAD